MPGKIAHFILIGAVLTAVGSACGYSVRETLPPIAPGAAADQMRRVVVLPLADRTPSSSAYEYAQRGEMVDRIVEEQFYRAGLYPISREDVIFFLSGQGVVQIYGALSPESKTLQGELRTGEWSEPLQREISRVIDENRNSRVLAAGSRDKAYAALDEQVIRTMGAAFGADYVIRGGIAYLGVKAEDSFDPMQIGLFPLIFKSTGRTLFGTAEMKRYGEDDSFYSALEVGKIPNATLQLWLRAQDPQTGETFWMNRVEVRSKRNSIYDEPDRDDLFEAAVRQAAASLADDFLRSAAGRRARLAAGQSTGVAGPPVSEAVTSTGTQGGADAAEALRAAEEAKRAALEAKEAAGSASKSARKAEAIFDKINTK